MNENIPELKFYDEPELDTAFASLRGEIDAERKEVRTEEQQEAFRVRWTGRRQGRLKLIGEAWLKSAPPQARKSIGIKFNEFKQYVEEVQHFASRNFVRDTPEWGVDLAYIPLEEKLGKERKAPALDISLPGTPRTPGIAHPLLETMEAVVKVFHQLGYSTNLGPQVETDFYNFEALNFPPNHPARDTQDTLQIAAQGHKPSRDRLLMRTHTSPVQIRAMVAGPPPLRIVIPGKVHRNDAADATHSPIFHQVEGLCVDTNITFSDLKGTLDHAMRALFGSAVKTRFFPSFFPFTEPSADVQISCIFCGGSGCRKCKHSGWIELLGCGMVDPAVFAAVTAERRKLGMDDNAYDPARISGFAFGMGVERIAMILHGVSDIGLFYSGDMRFLEQFA